MGEAKIYRVQLTNVVNKLIKTQFSRIPQCYLSASGDDIIFLKSD